MAHLTRPSKQIHDNGNENGNQIQVYVDHVYNSVDISRFRYELLEFKSGLQQLLEKKFFVSANYSGSNCLLVFCKIMDKYYQFLIDRKTLSYNSKKVNYDLVKLTHVDINLDINIYKDRGTIFDGIFIINNNKKTFVITDVYLFKGEDTTNTPINMKLLSVSTYLNSVYKFERDFGKNNEMKIIVNKLYDLNSIEDLINVKIPEEKEFLIKGVCFFPEQSGTRLIYMFDNKNRTSTNTTNTNKFTPKTVYNNFNTKNNTPPETPNVRNMKPNTISESKITPKPNTISESKVTPKQNTISESKVVPKPLDINTTKNITSDITPKNKNVYVPKHGTLDTDYIFEMKKTNTIDVYNLNIVELTVKENTQLLKRIKIGLAYVSSLERSKWCQEIMKQCNGSTLVHCKFHDEKQKWEPISVAKNATRPSFVEEFTVIEV